MQQQEQRDVANQPHPGPSQSSHHVWMGASCIAVFFCHWVLTANSRCICLNLAKRNYFSNLAIFLYFRICFFFVFTVAQLQHSILCFLQIYFLVFHILFFRQRRSCQATRQEFWRTLQRLSCFSIWSRKVSKKETSFWSLGKPLIITLDTYP